MTRGSALTRIDLLFSVSIGESLAAAELHGKRSIGHNCGPTRDLRSRVGPSPPIFAGSDLT